MSDSITSGLQAYLAADSALTTACPGGVWVEPGPQGVTQPFVTVELVTAQDEGCGGGPSLTTYVYEVVVVAPAASVSAARTGAARLQALLDYVQGWSLTGYTVSGCRRTAPIDEHEEAGSGRWVRLGGEYTLVVDAT